MLATCQNLQSINFSYTGELRIATLIINEILIINIISVQGNFNISHMILCLISSVWH